MAPISIKLYFDVDTLGFGGAISVPSSLKDLLESLPDGAASLLDWMPDIVLGELGVAFTAPNRAFSLYADAGIAGSADPAAQAFLATLPSPTTGKYTIVVGLALTTPVDFSSIPVVGTLMSGIALDDLAIVYSGDNLPAGSVILPPPAHKKEPAFKKGLSLVLTLESGGAKQSFALSPSNSGSKTLQRLNMVAEDGGPPIQWFNVQKKLGPLTIGRVGLATSGEWFGVGLDASLELTGLAIDLVGFTAGFPKDNISLEGLDLSLDGLSVFFSSGGVLILGSLLRSRSNNITSYNGALLIQAGPYGIAAIGSFAQVQGAISLFVFGAVQGVFGGPPAFVVTGIAAGFGYNRSLKLPEGDKVLEFPLVLVATLGKSYLPNPKDVATMLEKLDSAGAVPPSIGSYWVAAGIQFSTFQMLNTFAMISVEFGKDLVIGLIGVTALSLPRGLSRPLAFAEMTLSAVLRPLEGSFKMMAVLTPRSFVLDENCRLTGGFAFYLWFGNNEHSGDFVVTLGGYNPYFVPEDWYPKVPRLGFNWTLSSVLRASGGTYFALTPSSVMAGGALDIRFDAGNLKAWFTAHADFIMWWKPFYFIVDIGVSIGASYTVDFGVATKTFSIELSAGLLLFGPPIAGIAHVKWWVISFDIPINGGGKPNPPGRTIKDWSAFASTYFPPAGPTAKNIVAAPNSPVVRPLVTAGLLSELEDDHGAIWLVSPNLSLGTETLVPATRMIIAAPKPEQQRRYDGPGTGVYPLGSVKLASGHTLTVRADTSNEVIDLSAWDFTPSLQRAPGSMWGLENSGKPPVSADVMPALLGLSAVPSLPKMTGPEPAPLELLAFSNLKKRELPLPDIAPIDGSTPAPEVDPTTAVAQTVALPATNETRDALVAVMNAAKVGQLIGGDLSLLAEEVRYTFQEPPMLGPLGSTGPKQPQSTAQERDVGSRRVKGSKRSPIALAQRGYAARLRSMYRRQSTSEGRAPREWCEQLIADGFTTRAERAALAAHQGRTTFESGTIAVFDVPEASGLSLESAGALMLEVIGLDRQDRIVAVEQLAECGAWTVPDAVARIAVLAREPCPEGQMIGWTGRSALVLAAPQVLLADRVAIRAQSPVRLPYGRSTRARGVITGRSFSLQNKTLGEEVEAGWTETVFPAGQRSAIVILGRDKGPAGSPMDTDVWFGGLGEQGLSLRPLRAFFDEEDVVLSYALPLEKSAYLRAVVRPPSGYRHDGFLATSSALHSLDVSRLLESSAPRSTTRNAQTEVCFR
jgi:hypothetical protein